MKPHERIIFALDVDTEGAARGLVDMLHEHVGMFKVGLELFMAGGPSIVRYLGAPVMLDLKLHDIPETVERAVKRAVDLGVRFCTLHVQQRAALERAVRAVEGSRTKLLAVTVLTSMGEQDLRDLGLISNMLNFSIGDRVADLAIRATSIGVHGLVCSPQEVQRIRSSHPNTVLVIPGIRPTHSSAQEDQIRVGTPKGAILNGADYLVVGRPIRDAPDRVRAAQDIAAEIQTAEVVMESRKVTTGRASTLRRH